MLALFFAVLALLIVGHAVDANTTMTSTYPGASSAASPMGTMDE